MIGRDGAHVGAAAGLEHAQALVVLRLLRALGGQAEGQVVRAPLGGRRAAQRRLTAGVLVGLAGGVVVHRLVGGDDVLGEVVVLRLAAVDEGGRDRVAQAQHVGGRVLRRVHGRDAGLHLLGRGVDVLVVEVRVPDVVAAVLLQCRVEHLLHRVLVVGVVGADDAEPAGLPVEVLGRVVGAGVLRLARRHVDARHLVAPPLGERRLHPAGALPRAVEVRRVGVGELVAEAVAAHADRLLAGQLGVAGGAQGGVPEDDVRVVRVDDLVHLGDQALVVGRHALAPALVGLDVHLAPVEHVVLVEEDLHGLVELLGVGVGDEGALGLEDGVHLGAVVGDVVDDGDRVLGDALVGGAAVVGEGAARGSGRARGRPPGNGGVVLAAVLAVRGVAAGRHARRRRRRAPPAGHARRHARSARPLTPPPPPPPLPPDRSVPPPRADVPPPAAHPPAFSAANEGRPAPAPGLRRHHQYPHPHRERPPQWTHPARHRRFIHPPPPSGAPVILPPPHAAATAGAT